MTSTISPPAQAAAVRRAAVNHQGPINNLRDPVTRGKRPKYELDLAAQRLPALLAAADTIEQFNELLCARAVKADGPQLPQTNIEGRIKK